MFELWKHELTTPESIENKLNEIKTEYKNYLTLCKQYNWKQSTVNKNIYVFKKIIESFEKALKEVKA